MRQNIIHYILHLPFLVLAFTASVFDNDASATSAQTNIYSQMVSYNESYNLVLQTGFLGDELTSYSTVSTMQEYYEDAMLSSSITSPWVDGYNYIYQANAVIQGLQTGSGITTATFQQLTGEAKFTRAFWNFILTNCYGAIPLATTTDYSITSTLSRTAQPIVYQQIITDLTAAEGLLSANYVDATDTSITTDRVRPTKWAAAALLARVYLYTGSYDSAIQQATFVINGSNGLYSLCDSLNNVFLANSSEAIWQLPPSQPSNDPYVDDAYFFVLSGAPSNGTSNNATISLQLMGSFEAGDWRMTHWIGVYPANGVNYYFPYKYKVTQTLTPAPAEYNMVLRLGEQYLIRAEAYAQQGNTNGALADLNAIRNRAGLMSYGGATDKNSLLAAIFHERQVEMFTEWGNRWFDLKRTDSMQAVMSVVCPYKGGGSWNSTKALYPLPLSDLNIDVNLKQNPGY